MRKYYSKSKNAKRRKEYMAAYSKKNYAKIQAYNNQWRLDNPALAMLHRLKASAKRQHRKFNLTVEDIIIPDVCPILGIKIKKAGKRTGRSPSCDRLDPSKGYIKGNVRFISNDANRMKQNNTLETFQKFIQYLKGEI